MASVSIDHAEAFRERLPPVCMQCGADATEYVHRQFAWNPGWVYILLLFGLLPVLIAVYVTRKTMTVDCPMCAAHRNHWSKRLQFTWIGFFLVVCLGVGFIFIGQEDRDIGSFLAIIFFVIFFAWLIAAALYNNSAIKATLITSYEITLTSLSRDFVEALHDDRDAFDERRRQLRAEDRRRREIEDYDNRDDEPDDDRHEDRRDDRRGPPNFDHKIR